MNLSLLLLLLVNIIFFTSTFAGTESAPIPDEFTVGFTSLNETVSSTTCGGNCPGGCSTCPCGSSSSYQSASSWCAQYSGWSQSQCQCIINAESGANANAVNENTSGSLDVGLWQINSMNWASCSSGSAPCSPSTNLNCAIMVWKWGGNTFKLWSTCSKCGAC